MMSDSVQVSAGLEVRQSYLIPQILEEVDVTKEGVRQLDRSST